MYAPEEAQNAITVRHIAKVLEIAVVKLWKWGRAMLKLWARHHAGFVIKENTEDTQKGNRKGGSNNETIF